MGHIPNCCFNVMLTISGLDDLGIKYSVAERYVPYLSLLAGAGGEKKPIWLSEPMAFSSAGKRAACTVIASLELRAYGEPVFFVVSKHETVAQ